MELVIVSGKGGTGKTSLVGALASLAKNSVLVDCDVDAADLHLIMNGHIEQTSEFIGGKRASIIREKCIGCGICAAYCRFEAIVPDTDPSALTMEKLRVNTLACEGCGVCRRHCPEKAIEFNEVVSGQWYVSGTPYGPMVHARLGLAQANSGKLVSLLRQQAMAIARRQDSDLIIIDGPPGIGCPVIASTTGADYILIVTEPSMSALHDLERLVRLTEHFGIPTGVCINKYDINRQLTSRIIRFARARNVRVMGKIPDDPTVTAAQIAGTTIIDHNHSGAAGAIVTLWSKLCEELQNKDTTDAPCVFDV